MKILKSMPVPVDIGPLDHKLRLPMAGRMARGMKTTCDACGKAITDEFFIGGFKTGHANLKLHEACADGQDPDWCYLCDRPKNDCACGTEGSLTR
jgi:hypothetical protein